VCRPPPRAAIAPQVSGRKRDRRIPHMGYLWNFLCEVPRTLSGRSSQNTPPPRSYRAAPVVTGETARPGGVYRKPLRPGPDGLPQRGHNTSERYYAVLM